MNKRNVKPKNHFGIRLTVSVIMIFLCPIAGITALIFAICANKNYKRQCYEQWSEQTIVMNLCLVVGALIGIATYGVFLMIGLKYQEAGQSKPTKRINLWTETEEEAYKEETAYQDEYTKFCGYTRSGKTYLLPMTVEEFEESGFSMEEDVYTTELEAESSDTYSYYDAEGNMVGMVEIYNLSASEKKAKECRIYSVSFYDVYDLQDFELYEGLNRDSTYEEFCAVFGDPKSSYLEGNYNWDLCPDNNINELRVEYEDGKLYAVSIKYPYY